MMCYDVFTKGSMIHMFVVFKQYTSTMIPHGLAISIGIYQYIGI